MLHPEILPIRTLKAPRGATSIFEVLFTCEGDAYLKPVQSNLSSREAFLMDQRQVLINDTMIWANASDEHFMTKPTRSQLERVIRRKDGYQQQEKGD